MPDGKTRHLWIPVIVIALTITISAQMFRTLFPLVIFNPHATPDLIARHLMFVFLAPFVMPCLSRLLHPRRLLIGSLVGLAVLRLGMQLSNSTELSLLFASSGVILAFTAQLLLLGGVYRVERLDLAAGFVTGLMLDVLLTSSWDYVWQRTPAAYFAALSISLTLLIAVWLDRKQIGDPQMDTIGHTLWVILLGPFWVLQLSVLNNPAYAGVSSVVVLLGDLLGLFLLLRFSRLHSPIIRAAAFFAFAFLLWWTGTDPAHLPYSLPLMLVLGCVFLVQWLCPLRIAVPDRLWLKIPGWGISSLLFVLLVALNYAGYQYALPAWISPAVLTSAGVLFALAALRSVSVAGTTPIGWRVVTFPMLFVCGMLLLPVIRPEVKPSPAAKSELRIMSYNIHQGANTDGWIDLEGLAQTIEAQHPDVVLLQEVTRGQLITGNVDTLAWLASRLTMYAEFSPAQDTTFGVALLSRFEIRAWYPAKFAANGVQTRSYIAGTVNPGGANPYITIVGTHLDLNAQVRYQQVEELIQRWTRERKKGPLLIAGDMNTAPDSSEMKLFQTAGLVSAQDITGNGALTTFPSTNPKVRIDWIFGTPDITFSNFVIPQSTASDHLPIVVTARFAQ